MNIGVYGLGRFGSFWAARLAEHLPAHTITAWSRNQSHSVPPGVRRGTFEELCRCDTIVLCVAISAMDAVCKELGERIGESTLVMDTCSVKVHPVEAMRRHFSPGVAILATHPMFGPDSGRNGIAGLPLVFSPVRGDPVRMAAWKNRFVHMGLNVIEMTPAEHDREAAYTQGITHFIGRVLDDLDLQGSDIATYGYAQLLNIVEQTCNDPLSLFHDLQTLNPYTREMRLKLKKSLDKVLAQLD